MNPHSPELGLTQSILILPPDYDPNISYPLLVLMPYTGGSSIDFFNKYLREASITATDYSEQFAAFLEIFKTQFGQDKNFILMLTHGVGSTAHHNFEGFHRCIEQYENRLKRDFKTYFNKYNIDQKKVYMAGVSLGGDLSWAFSVKQPDWLQGAIVLASRCSYPTQDSVLKKLADKNYSFFMVMGMSESPDRLAGISYAKNLLTKAGINHSYREMPYLEHDRAPLWLFMEGINFVMFENHNSLKNNQKEEILTRISNTYKGELGLKKYQLDAETNIHLDGDGLWLLQSEETRDGVEISFFVDDKNELFLEIKHPDFAQIKLKCFLNVNEKGEICLQIPAQNVKNVVYKGISHDINSLSHGFFIYNQLNNFLSFDIEKYSLNKANQRTHYSFFHLFK